MKYFGYKDNVGYGFFEELFTGAVSVTEKQWQELLDEQSAGKDIVMFKGSVFVAEPNTYYLDETGHFKKYTEDEMAQLKGVQQILSDNNTALNFLNDTDWKVTRHRDQLSMGIETSLTDEEYTQLLKERQEARDKVIHEEDL